MLIGLPCILYMAKARTTFSSKYLLRDSLLGL